MKIACVVSHMDEPLLNVSLITISKANDSNVEVQRVVAGKSPMCASFNAALDIAWTHECDVLIHTASDVLLQRHALTVLLSTLDLDRHFVAVARGYDAIHGLSSGGLWAFNMRVVADKFRFRDVFKQDLDLCERIEAATGLECAYTPPGDPLTYHHPVWTARELYGKYRYSYPKYTKAKTQATMRAFLEIGLQRNPGNKALLAGTRGLVAAQRRGPMRGAKSHEEVEKEFIADCADLTIEGTEFYVKHQHYQSLARAILDSADMCVCEPPDSLTPLIKL